MVSSTFNLTGRMSRTELRIELMHRSWQTIRCTIDRGLFCHRSWVRSPQGPPNSYFISPDFSARYPKSAALTPTRFDLFRAELPSGVRSKTGVRIPELELVLVWTDAVRTARNTIHFGADTDIADSYGSVAVLVISGTASLKKLNAIKRLCTELDTSDEE